MQQTQIDLLTRLTLDILKANEPFSVISVSQSSSPTISHAFDIKQASQAGYVSYHYPNLHLYVF